MRTEETITTKYRGLAKTYRKYSIQWKESEALIDMLKTVNKE